jgi:hypothetical protein
MLEQLLYLHRLEQLRQLAHTETAAKKPPQQQAVAVAVVTAAGRLLLSVDGGKGCDRHVLTLRLANLE